MQFQDTFLTTEQYFDILQAAVNDAYQPTGPWHPEDIATHVASANEVLLRGLSEYSRILFDRSKTQSS